VHLRANTPASCARSSAIGCNGFNWLIRAEKTIELQLHQAKAAQPILPMRTSLTVGSTLTKMLRIFAR
jgi:hypothetical protein